MKRAASLLVVIAVTGCSAKRHSQIERPQPDGGTAPTAPAGQGGGATAVDDDFSPCGTSGEVCCAAPLPECRLGLRCDSETRACVAEEQVESAPLLCRGNDDCPVGTTCCVMGLLGTCEDMDPADCPLPDLSIVLPALSQPSTLATELPPDACAIQMGCALGSGLRRMLDVSPVQIVNLGDADALIGDPNTSPGFRRVECDGYGQNYPHDYLLYELVDGAGAVVATGRGSLNISCDAFDPPDQTFIRLVRGFTYNPLSGYCPMGCSGIDLDGIEPGNYTFRLTINPELPGSSYPNQRLLRESDYSNNSLSLRVSIPAYDRSTQACPDPFDPIFGFVTSRECGWARAAEQLFECTPGSALQLGCQVCDYSTQMLRACRGAEPCSAETSLAVSSQAAYDCSASGDGTLLVSCATYCCGLVTCPMLTFTCPDDGVYSLWVASPNQETASMAPSCEPIVNPRLPTGFLCGDGNRNGSESDIDCGGSESGCRPCPDFYLCTDGGDCESGVCTGGICGNGVPI
jgi:hypothetical protein